MNNEHRKILCIRFNQFHSCVSVGSTHDFRVYTCQAFKKCYHSEKGGYRIVQMLHETSLVALVGGGEVPSLSPRCLRIFNSKTEKCICELNFISTILNVQLNKSRLIVVLLSKIHVFDLKTMKVLHTVDTPSNPHGICGLSPSIQNCFMAFPANQEKGEVLIYDALNLQVVSVVRAHNNSIRFMSFNPEGTLLATASDMGTVVRVHSIPDGKKLFTFRRGSYAATINSISFNVDSSLLCTSSVNSNTVYVFALTPNNLNGPEKKSQDKTSKVNLTNMSKYLTNLPGLLSDLVDPSRDYATIHLKDNTHASGCGFFGTKTIMVVTQAGYLYSYLVTDEGCKLETEHSLLDKPSEEYGVKLNPYQDIGLQHEYADDFQLDEVKQG